MVFIDRGSLLQTIQQQTLTSGPVGVRNMSAALTCGTRSMKGPVASMPQAAYNQISGSQTIGYSVHHSFKQRSAALGAPSPFVASRPIWRWPELPRTKTDHAHS